MASVGDLVLQTANSPGTGTFSLIAPPTGRVSWVTGCGVGAGRFYYAHDGTNWEVGNGTVTSGSPDTLSRDTVYRNSLGTTAKINFTGTVNTYNDIPSDRAFWADASGVYQAQSRRIAGLGAGTATSDAIRWDQAGGIKIATYGVTTGSIVVPLPNGTDICEIELSNVGIAANAGLFFRVSVNGGSTYLTGASEYNSSVKQHSATGGYTTQALTPGTYLALSQTLVTAFGIQGTITVLPALRQFRSHLCGFTGTGISNDDAAGYWATATAPTHILIGGVSTTITSGSARLVQRA